MTFLQSITITDTDDSKNEQKHTEKKPKVANDSKPSVVNFTGINNYRRPRKFIAKCFIAGPYHQRKLMQLMYSKYKILQSLLVTN